MFRTPTFHGTPKEPRRPSQPAPGALVGVSIAVLLVGVAGCASPAYADLDIGSCISGNLFLEDAYDVVDCEDGQGFIDGGRINANSSWTIVDKMSDDGSMMSPCEMTAEAFTDGETVICVEPVFSTD